MIIQVPMWAETDSANHCPFTHYLCKKKKTIIKGDRKIESVYVNCQFSMFPCWSRKWTETWSTGIPVSPYAPFSLTQDPTVMEGGEESYCVCVCVHSCMILISCFIEETVVTCTYRSHFHCEKKTKNRTGGKKKRQFSWIRLGNNYHCFWEARFPQLAHI